MPSIATVQELVNGARHLVLKVDIEGDGVTEIEDTLVEVGAYNCREVRLDSIKGNIDIFALDLTWDGPTEAALFTIGNETAQTDFINLDWSKTGGQINPKVANYTGDVNMTTRGLGNGEKASLEFHFIKKRIP